METEFWREWKRKTKLEEEAIKSLKKAKKVILEKISGIQLISIYVKGSFVRREMNKDSDVDFIVVVKDDYYLKKIKVLNEKYEKVFIPPVNISGFSLKELKMNKRSDSSNKTRGKPDIFTNRIRNYKLIYGNPLENENFMKRTNKEQFKGLIKAFETVFLPLYHKNQFGFQELIKQVFWLVDLEQKVKGKEIEHSWKKLANSIKDKNHIIHDTLRLRIKHPKDKKIKEKYIDKLEKYIKSLRRKQRVKIS